MDYMQKQEQELLAKQKLQERSTELEICINSLMRLKEFRRFLKEITLLQSIDDARCFDNALAMAYNNGRRSILVEIKGLLTEKQWLDIMEFDLHERN